jgi:glycosyltransferase involved in cell wall biosynthesis
MPPVRSISVLLPILNGARYLDRVLSSLARQQISIPWDFLALDCGSTDGTLEILDRHAQAFPVPLRV